METSTYWKVVRVISRQDHALVEIEAAENLSAPRRTRYRVAAPLVTALELARRCKDPQYGPCPLIRRTVKFCFGSRVIAEVDEGAQNETLKSLKLRARALVAPASLPYLEAAHAVYCWPPTNSTERTLQNDCYTT